MSDLFCLFNFRSLHRTTAPCSWSFSHVLSRSLSLTWCTVSYTSHLQENSLIPLSHMAGPFRSLYCYLIRTKNSGEVAALNSFNMLKQISWVDTDTRKDYTSKIYRLSTRSWLTEETFIFMCMKILFWVWDVLSLPLISNRLGIKTPAETDNTVKTPDVTLSSLPLSLS